MAKQNMGGVYANMDFPPYSYQPYPRHIVTGPHGKYEVAHSAEEESKILAKLQKDQDDAPAEPVHFVADPEKEILISRARELQVPFNSLWSKAKLKKLVEQAEADTDVDSLPAEDLERKKLITSITAEDVEEEEAAESAEDYKETLIAKARNLGINANKLWGIPRLKASIAEKQVR